MSEEKQREKISRYKTAKEKIGHRRVTDGVVTYKRQPTSELVVMIQHGLQCALGLQSNKQHDRDVLMQDFSTVEALYCPHNGSELTPAHSVADFYFKVYAPLAFRKFRGTYGIKQADFLASLCSKPLHELQNAGASGSVFYLTDDDEFILKTVQKREARFLQQLLPGYYLNLSQNPRTLLPKFYGLYRVKTLNKNIRIVVMNNILPRTVRIHEKFDLKGSRYKRRASERERAKPSPTWKDLDFDEMYPKGILLDVDTLDALVKTLERDCLVLESFQIMDYSLLVGLQYVDSSYSGARRTEPGNTGASTSHPASAPAPAPAETAAEQTTGSLNEQDEMASPNVSGLRSQTGSFRGTQSQNTTAIIKRLASYATASESIALGPSGTCDEPGAFGDSVPLIAIGTGGIPVVNEKGDRALLYLGIIDVLQNYGVAKQLEHAWKALVYDANDVSVHRPAFYKTRFLKYLCERVFLERPLVVKHTPLRKKSMLQLQASTGGEQQQTGALTSASSAQTRTKRNSVVTATTTSRPDSGTDQQAPLLSLLKSIEERDKESLMKLEILSATAHPTSREKEAMRGRSRSAARGNVSTESKPRSVSTESNGKRTRSDSVGADHTRPPLNPQFSVTIELIANDLKIESSTDANPETLPNNERDTRRQLGLESTPL